MIHTCRHERLVWATPARVFDELVRVGVGGTYPGVLLDRLLWGARTALAPVLIRGGRSRGHDHWEVIDSDPGRRHALRCELRGIGMASIAWSIEPRPGDRSLLVQSASIDAAGSVGTLYWHATRPPHALAFARLINNIGRSAERDAPHLPPTRPTDGLRIIRREITVPGDVASTFAFFADARNLEAITPEWLHFEILTPTPIEMSEGTTIDYRIRLHGLAVRWHTRIDAWAPGVRFIDRQVRGPYRWWHHEHRFVSGENGTRVIDEVEYVSPFRMVSEPLLVRRDLRRIFDDRGARLAKLLGGAAASTS